MALSYFAGLALFMDFISPPATSLSSKVAALLYSVSNLQFRLGVMQQLLSAGFLIPWAVVFAVLTKQGPVTWNGLIPFYIPLTHSRRG